MALEVGSALALLAGAVPDRDRADAALFEHWAQVPHWPALTVGLPLMVGVRPQAWPELLASVPAAATLQAALAEALQLPPASDQPVLPARLRVAAKGVGIVPPPYLGQLLDFLGRVLPRAEADVAGDAGRQALAAEERETLLGIALMLVTRLPRDCVDEAGYYSAARIAELILQKSVRWFPLAPPTLDRAGIEALLAGWITPGG